jgi:hypothetical protein
VSSVTHTRASGRPGGRKNRALLSPPLGRRAFVRIDLDLMEAPVIGQLSDTAFRAWLALLSYVSRWRGECDHVSGEFPRVWAKFAIYAKPLGTGRVTEKQLERFIGLGLLDRLVDEDGKEWLRVTDWRDVHPLEWTGAIRQERWRQRHGYYGRHLRRPGDPLPEDPVET